MKNHERSAFDFRELFEASSEVAKANMASARDVQKLAADFWLRLGSEGLRFVSSRISAQASLLEGLRGCADAKAAGEKEAQFLANSADEYRQAFQRIGEITREAGDRILAVQPGVTRNNKAA